MVVLYFIIWMYLAPCCWTSSLLSALHYEQNYDGHLCISNLVCTHDCFPHTVLEVKMSFDCWLVEISL